MPDFLLTLQPLIAQQRVVTAETEADAIATIDGEEFNILRIQNVDEFVSEFSPRVRFEYDEKYFGGQYEQVGDYAYVPLAFVSDMEVKDAFLTFTGIDPVHIISFESETNHDELVLEDGEGWLESADKWAEDVVAALAVDGESPEVCICAIENDGFYDIEIEVSPEEVCSTRPTGTHDLNLAIVMLDSVKAVFRGALFKVFSDRDEWEQSQSKA